MVVQVAGPTGELCDNTQLRVEQLIAEHGLDSIVERIIDFDEIVALKVYAVPGILIDGVLKSVGRIPDHDEIIRWLTENVN